MNLKTSYVSWIKETKCPCCGVGKFEFFNTNNNGILVNVESKGRVKIDNFWIPSSVCNNPLCEWSKVNVKSLNLTSNKEAWDKAPDEEIKIESEKIQTKEIKINV